MSTKMTGEDWAVALEVFQASLPRGATKAATTGFFWKLSIIALNILVTSGTWMNT
ncbi:hypothetical protein ABE530_14360 [Brucella sp. TWI559]